MKSRNLSDENEDGKTKPSSVNEVNPWADTIFYQRLFPGKLKEKYRNCLKNTNEKRQTR